MSRRRKIIIIIFLISLLILSSFYSFLILNANKNDKTIQKEISVKTLYSVVHTNLESQANAWRNNSHLRYIIGGPVSRNGKSPEWYFSYYSNNLTNILTQDIITFLINEKGMIQNKEYSYNNSILSTPIVNWTLDSDQIMDAVYNDTELANSIKSNHAVAASLSIENKKTDLDIPVCTIRFTYLKDDEAHEFSVRVNAHTGAIIR